MREPQTTSSTTSELVARSVAGCPSDSIALAVYAAVIARGESAVTKQTLQALRARGVTAIHAHEVTLQSYLFCGFPRMLDALFDLVEVYDPREFIDEPARLDAASLAYTPAEADTIARDGLALIRRIYGDSYARLESAITRISPAVHRRIVLEGYGATLSRPQLDALTRELCVVTTLTYEWRPRQLRAHVRGAGNVGAAADTIFAALEAISAFTPIGHVNGARRLVEEIVT